MIERHKAQQAQRREEKPGERDDIQSKDEGNRAVRKENRMRSAQIFESEYGWLVGPGEETRPQEIPDGYAASKSSC